MTSSIVASKEKFKNRKLTISFVLIIFFSWVLKIDSKELLARRILVRFSRNAIGRSGNCPYDESYGINDNFAIKRVNLSVFRSEYCWLNYASAYLLLFSFSSHVTRKSSQEKSSYKLWNQGFEFLNFHMTCYISYDSVYSAELKNMHFIKILWLWSKLRLFFALSGQNDHFRQ